MSEKRFLRSKAVIFCKFHQRNQLLVTGIYGINYKDILVFFPHKEVKKKKSKRSKSSKWKSKGGKGKVGKKE